MRTKRDEGTSYRSARLLAAPGGPSTLSLEARSVDVVAATEEPVRMWDWEHGEIDEVLLVKGAVLPASKQLPLLDAHSRESTADVVGSARQLRRSDGQLLATAVLSGSGRGPDILAKIAEGHITDVSIGYRVSDSTVVPKGEKAVIGGRTWKGPVRVVTSWIPKELSVVPIGADQAAKVRSEHPGDRISVQVATAAGAQRANKENDMELNERMEALEGAVSKIADSVGKLAEKTAGERKLEDASAEVERLRQDKLRQAELTVQKERERLAEVDKMCARFDIDDEFRTRLIQDGTPVDKARELVLERIAARGKDDPTTGLRVSFGADERDKSRAAAVEGVQVRAGIRLAEEQNPQGNEYANLTLYEMACARLRMANQSTRGLGKREVFQRALSTSDFPNILADAANKALLEGFELADETYSQWVDTTGRLNDYKPHQFSRASEAPAFSEVNPDGGEYTYGKMTDKKETVTAKDYGVIVPFTRAAMINDDLGALADIRTKMGREAAATWGDLCYAVLTGNPTMGDGIALFHASSHGGNLVTSGAVPSVTTLNTGAKIMANQKGLLGTRALNIRPIYLLAGFTQKGTVDQLVTVTTPASVGSLGTATSNPWAYLQPVYDARLDANASGNPWFLAGRKALTVKLFTLDGALVPVLEQRVGWEIDGMEFKARISGAAAPVDYAGLFQNDGA